MRQRKLLLSLTQLLNGTATRGVDFIAPASGIATITTGTTGSIDIPIVDDNIAEDAPKPSQ